MDKMQKLGIIWGIVVVLLVVLLTVFGFVYKNKTSVYKELEDKIVEAGKKYVDAHFLYPESHKEAKILVEDMISEGYMDELKTEDVSCKGYLIVSHKTTVFDYKGYVSCGDYKTKGYAE